MGGRGLDGTNGQQFRIGLLSLKVQMGLKVQMVLIRWNKLMGQMVQKGGVILVGLVGKGNGS